MLNPANYPYMQMSTLITYSLRRKKKGTFRCYSGGTLNSCTFLYLSPESVIIVDLQKQADHNYPLK